MNIVTLIGRATRDPELRYTQNGTAFTRFSLAIDKQLAKDKKAEFEAQGKPTADFINCVTWGKQAEFIANNLGKGGRVGVTGNIESGSYQDKDGKTVYTTDVNVRTVDLIDWKNSNNQGSQGLDGFDDIPMDNVPF